VAIAGKDAQRFFSVDKLDDAALARVAEFLAKRPATPLTWAASTAAVTKSLRGRLQTLRDGKLVSYDPGARSEPEFYLAYFGAHWCGPCRSFSPGLVAAYTRLKEKWGDRFEVVFVSSDRDPDEQLLYARELKMPWPVVKYSALGSIAPVERWSARGIPNLVVLTREGEAIFTSYRGEEYLGASEPLKNFENLLPALATDSPQSRRSFHRLAVMQHLRAVGTGTSLPKPYFIPFDHSRYRTLDVKSVNAALEIDEKGKVTSARFEPELPTVIDFQLVRDASDWLFLPAVEQGQPKATKVVLPIVF
jgi:thiol-disulfide isomerase/thioredoxin